jgi:hypothetical protein
MPIEAKGAVVVMGLSSRMPWKVLADYPRGGSSRSIPLADIRLNGQSYIVPRQQVALPIAEVPSADYCARLFDAVPETE